MIHDKLHLNPLHLLTPTGSVLERCVISFGRTLNFHPGQATFGRWIYVIVMPAEDLTFSWCVSNLIDHECSKDSCDNIGPVVVMIEDVGEDRMVFTLRGFVDAVALLSTCKVQLMQCSAALRIVRN